MAPPPELIDDLAGEILLRIPPDDPSHLVRASLVCKPWRRLLTDPAFLRRHRAFHRTPYLLGFIHNVEADPRFVLITTTDDGDDSPFSAPAIDWHNFWWALDCRHGRVLIHLFDPMELMVWDPITGDQHRFPLPSHPHMYCAGAVLCAARGCNHLDCQQGPFLVVFVGTCENNHSWACAYSSKTAEWSAQASIVVDSYVEMTPSILIKDTLYFNCEHGMRILAYDIARHEISVIDRPLGPDNGILIKSEYGGLGFASVQASGLQLWSRIVGDDGIEEWEESRVIELDMLILVDNPFHRLDLVGFAEDTHTIFISSDVGVFTVELKSGKVKEGG